MSESTVDTTATIPRVNLSEEDARRFREKVNRDGPPHPYDISKGACWLWTAGLFRDGYGKFRLFGKSMKAHRVSFMSSVKFLPSEIQVQHSCNRPACVNPAHLSEGTAKENKAYCIATGRHAHGDDHYSRTRPERLARGDRNGSRTHPEKRNHGEKNWEAKLKESDVLRIRETFVRKRGAIVALARQYGVGKNTMCDVVNNKSWRYLITRRLPSQP